MKHSPLPFVRLLQSLPEDERIARKNDAMKALVRCEGFQLVLEVLATVDRQHIFKLGLPGEEARHAGAIVAVGEIQTLLEQLYPRDAELPVEEPEEEYDLGELYESPFNFELPPSSAAPVSVDA